MNSSATRLIASHWGVPPDQLTAEPVGNRFFSSWTFWRFSDGNLPPRVAHVATRGEEADLITFEGGLHTQMQTDAPLINSRQDAVAFVDFFLSVSRPMAELLRSAAEVPGIDESEARAWGERIRPPRAFFQNGAYAVDGWLWEAGEVRFSRFHITSSGIRSEIDPTPVRLGVGITLD